MNEWRIEICRRVEEHAQQVMHWRNDPTTLSLSFDSNPKVWESFWQEYQDHYFRVDDLPSFFVCKNEKRVSFLRFRPVKVNLPAAIRTAEISINVDPLRRGEGIGKKSLALAAEVAGRMGYDALIADIAVGLGADYLKAGAPVRGERTAKYNRLLALEGALLI